ncbi:DUF2252_family protein [Hexamita inflata]|uniref:DUF2252 family protein n=1 Tax=Hexamita inflata TaxID=28002 RepID=A0AA86QZL9_9EUKA|nr:DUF2252 family protein [Hexamita inflata]
MLQSLDNNYIKQQRKEKLIINTQQNQIKNGVLQIVSDTKLKSLENIQNYDIKKLELKYCTNIIPKMQSSSITQLIIENCNIQSLKEFQLDNLEVLVFSNGYKDKTLVWEYDKFPKLKELGISRWTIDITLFSQMTCLTQLSIQACGLRNIEAIKPLIGLKQLCLACNENIDITPLQHLTQLTILEMESCCLINLDALRPLTKLQVLVIYDNQIVYIEPLLEFKQLSRMGAQNNIIIDLKILAQHPNFKKFVIYDLALPGQQQIQAANVMRNINHPITNLRKICDNLSSLKAKCSLFRYKCNSSLQINHNTLSIFIAQVADLLVKMNVYEDCQ